MRIAYYSPLPPERSGIADYSALLLPALQEKLDVTVIRRGGRVRFHRGSDIAVYHVGNDPQAHGWIVDAMRRQPGIVVIHDFVLHHLVAGMSVGVGNANDYLDAMQREAGVVGRLLAHGVIDGLVPPLWETRAGDFPLAREILDYATGVIAHSRFVERHVRAYGFRGPVWVIPHPAWPPPELQQPAPELAEGSPVFACVGNLTPSKRIPQLLEAFGRLTQEFPDAQLLLAGPASPRFDLGALLERARLRVGEQVHPLGYVDERDLWAILDRSDVCINLRLPTMGETSGAAIRALVLGRPLVVTDVGWFAELPDEVAAKVPVGELEVDVLTAVLARLAGDEELRAEMSRRAVEYVKQVHALDRVVELYVGALEEGAGRSLVQDAVVADLAEAIADVGLGENDRELRQIAGALREVGLGD
jgi:glycosyltransferase involved in cell wall biosynthesis